MRTQDNDIPLFCISNIMEKAKNGDFFAQFDIGKAYFHAYLTENNCSLGFKWISLSAHQGNMEAQFSLGDLYALGQGTEQSHTRAYEWYTKAALQGYSKALIRIHNLYEDDKFMHCKGYQSKKERDNWSRYYLDKIGARELSEYRLQQTKLVQNQAILFYQKKYNTIIEEKELNYAGEHLQLGFLHQHGYGTKRNIKRAIECYTIAAKEGVTEAQYLLGEIYLKKRSVKYRYQDVFKWLSKAAESGHIIAQYKLAYLYEKGIGVEKDHSKALDWYTKAANARYTTAQLSIARIYHTGQGIPQDYISAVKWYNVAAKAGDRAAQNCLDQLHSQDKIYSGENSISNLEYYKNPIDGRRINSYLRKHILEINDTKKARQLKKLAMSAMKRDINAMYEIGIKYRDGVDLLQDDDLSLRWIKKAARGGLEKAQLIMGESYEKGKLVEQNYHKTSIWYRKKYLQKSDVFQYNLGILFYLGKGVREDDLEASKWFYKSAEKGNSNSQFQIAQMRESGYGIREDIFEAFNWYIKSAYQRNCHAMYKLGCIYFQGLLMEKDPSKGILWYKLALNYGSGSGGCKLIDLYEYHEHELKDLALSNCFLEDSKIKYDGSDLYYKIAKCYLKGYIVTQNYCKAYYFIKKAIEIGYHSGKRWFFTPVSLESEIDCNNLLNMYKLVSEKGIDNLQYNIGYAYEFGIRGEYNYINSVKANISKAIKWYTAASNKGDSRAEYRLGVIYEEGKDVEKNLSKAIDFYTKAIEQANENAMYRLAHLYLRGKGVTQNYRRAYRLFTDAHNMNQSYSHLFLKFCKGLPETDTIKFGWESEIQSDEDDENELLFYSNEYESSLLSLKMLEAVGNTGNVAVHYQLGCLYENTDSQDRNYTKAAYWFTLASQVGVTDAYYRLGVLYEEGQGVEKSYSESLKLYQKAAAKYHDKALYRLARVYHYGLGAPVDFSKAFMLYKESAKQDNEMAKVVITLLQVLPNDSSQALSEKTSSLITSDFDAILKMYEYVAGDGNTLTQFDLGYYHEHNPLGSDYTKALKWYSIAKDSGHIGATYRLGKLYELGLGVTQDYGCAINLYIIAKEGGCNEATFRLGNMYQNGLGVNLDYKQAFNYYTEASVQGNPDAQSKLGQEYNQRTHNPANIIEALKWYTMSYLQGNDNVRDLLYLLYANDEPYGTFFDKRLANILLGFAKEQVYHSDKKIRSSSVIYARLCQMYLNGHGVQKDSNQAWYYLSIALDLEFDFGMKSLTNTTIQCIKDNASVIYNIALRQASKNDRVAHLLLGILYLGGVILLEETNEGGSKIYSSVFEDIYDLNDDTLYDNFKSSGSIIVPRDHSEALQQFLKAADNDCGYSKLMVALMYQCGYGTKQDFSKAYEYYQSSIENEYLYHACTKLYIGLLHIFGDGTNCDNNQALNYLEECGSYKHALFYLAQLYYYGDTSVHYYKAALKCLLMSANTSFFYFQCLIMRIDENELTKQPDTSKRVYSIVSKTVLEGEVEYLLGVMYEKGQGTRINYKEAFYRFSKAVKCGNKKAESHLELHYNDGQFIK